MKSLKNKKGFTIVELVIVIAVIAILAAVLIPTFSGVVDEAKKSAALSDAKNLWTKYCTDATLKNESFADFNGYILIDNKYYFEIKDGQLNAALDQKKSESTTGTAVTDYTNLYTTNTTTNSSSSDAK